MASEPTTPGRLVSVTLDGNSIGHGSAEQAHERQVAVDDLLEENSFTLEGRAGGAYGLFIALQDSKLVFDIRDAAQVRLATHILSLTPFRRLLKDYFMVCESYNAAIRTATPAQIEAIDMGRRGLHNDGAALLRERLKGKVDCDPDTARRLFTLICALHWKG